MTFIISDSIKTAIYVYCHDNVSLTIRLIILFPDQAEIKIQTFLCGDNSCVTILGMSALTDNQNVSIKTQQIHCGKNSSSRLVLQGLVAGKARTLYEGTIRIEEQASGTYALQHNKNILLSDTSTAISIPNIEVLNHDVQCYHGAAVGKFDIHQMQYMQSRGLDDAMIQQLLIQALFQEPLQGYENRELILQSVYKKINLF
jgi:Fe-S cluster assembly protein SufD